MPARPMIDHRTVRGWLRAWVLGLTCVWIDGGVTIGTHRRPQTLYTQPMSLRIQENGACACLLLLAICDQPEESHPASSRPELNFVSCGGSMGRCKWNSIGRHQHPSEIKSITSVQRVATETARHTILNPPTRLPSAPVCCSQPHCIVYHTRP